MTELEFNAAVNGAKIEKTKKYLHDELGYIHPVYGLNPYTTMYHLDTNYATIKGKIPFNLVKEIYQKHPTGIRFEETNRPEGNLPPDTFATDDEFEKRKNSIEKKNDLSSLKKSIISRARSITEENTIADIQEIANMAIAYGQKQKEYEEDLEAAKRDFESRKDENKYVSICYISEKEAFISLLSELLKYENRPISYDDIMSQTNEEIIKSIGPAISPLDWISNINFQALSFGLYDKKNYLLNFLTNIARHNISKNFQVAAHDRLIQLVLEVLINYIEPEEWKNEYQNNSITNEELLEFLINKIKNEHIREYESLIKALMKIFKAQLSPVAVSQTVLGKTIETSDYNLLQAMESLRSAIETFISSVNPYLDSSIELDDIKEYSKKVQIHGTTFTGYENGQEINGCCHMQITTSKGSTNYRRHEDYTFFELNFKIKDDISLMVEYRMSKDGIAAISIHHFIKSEGKFYGYFDLNLGAMQISSDDFKNSPATIEQILFIAKQLIDASILAKEITVNNMTKKAPMRSLPGMPPINTVKGTAN